MRRALTLSFLLLLLPARAAFGQATARGSSGNDAATSLAGSLLLDDLQALETEALRLSEPLAHALAKAEIAAAAWPLDEARAKRLLREAYELTFPDEAEQKRLRAVRVGDAPVLFGAVERARNEVRSRVFAVASRDRSFADELARMGGQQLGRAEEQFRFAGLAAGALEAGDVEAASGYVRQGVEVDPTQIAAALEILDVAALDSKAADKLIVEYIARVRSVPLSFSNESALRVMFILRHLLTAERNFKGQALAPPGRAAWKAYVGFVVESAGRMGAGDAEGARVMREWLLSAWTALKQHAPELSAQFAEAEKLTRAPGERVSLPQTSHAEARKESYEKRVKDALDSRRPDELTVNFAISRGDFDSARKMIEMLPDGAQKTQLVEMCDMREALALATSGDITGAQRLAERLNKATSILNVYPAIIDKCVAAKNQPCAAAAVYQAMKQIKRADSTPFTPPAGIPASILPGKTEFDPVLSGLSKLAKAVAPIDDALALEVLDETVRAANQSDIDTGQGRTGFDIDAFRLLAPGNETRTRQAAEALKDRLRRIAATASLYQWKAEELKAVSSKR